MGISPKAICRFMNAQALGVIRPSSRSTLSRTSAHAPCGERPASWAGWAVVAVTPPKASPAATTATATVTLRRPDPPVRPAPARSVRSCCCP